MKTNLFRVWEFVSRAARVLVKLDDFLLEAEVFWDWLTGKPEPEPESDERQL